MQIAEISRRWTDYFASQDHHIAPSVPLVSPDPSLLFTVAGMVPFIPYILGTEQSPYPRIASVQKCIRTKDIEEVGQTTRHGTFFQMLGNFSFGDYFKEGAINFAWELLTTPEDKGGYGFEPERFWVTIWNEDEEAYSSLVNVGVNPDQIVKLTREEIFWDTGQPGPAGPCAEWHYDRGPDYGPEAVGGTVDPGGDRYLEIWNLVFDQFLRGPGDGKDYPLIRELDQKAIDTGAGLERIGFLKQGVANFYETDEVFPVIGAVQQLTGRAYGDDHQADVRMRVIADHVRSSLMLIGDGVKPGNEGRGYVLRRLLRRSVRAMRLLGVEDMSLPGLLPVSKDAMKASYPQLETDFARISEIAYAEEDAFMRTLTKGTTILDSAVAKTKTAGGTVLSGTDAFQLHDTYGFPIDLTLEMASEQGLGVDETAFRSLMNEQRERARADSKAKKGGHADPQVYQEQAAKGETSFLGYDELQAATTVRALIKDGLGVLVAHEGETVEVILDETPFYPESGGQDSDSGVIRGGSATADVVDVQRPVPGLIVHTVTIAEGSLAVGDPVNAEVDSLYRREASRAHSATHLVHAALHQVLGTDANQAGSYNRPGYMRLDFSWTSGVSEAARAEVEEIANRAIRDDHEVSTRIMKLDEAKALGAMALFGEKYGDRVRVVEIGGPFSRELCAGTHVGSSSEVGLLTITSEGSVGSGARRVEALVGADAFGNLAAERAIVHELSQSLKVQPGELRGRVEKLVERLSATEKELAQFRQKELLGAAAGLADSAVDVAGVSVVASELAAAEDADGLRAAVTDVRARLGEDRPSVVALFGVAGGRPVVAVATNEAARGLGLKAGALVKEATSVLGGGGGGKPDLAQGGGQDAAAIPAAIDAVTAAVARHDG